MINLFSFCDCPWWLLWLLPFLLGLGLGLLLGHLLWGKYKSMVEGLESEIGSLKATIRGLEADLKACRSRNTELEGEIALLRGRIREYEARHSATVKVAAPAASAIVASAAAPRAGIATDKFAALKSDNLQVVEGIGPKMDEVCKSNGIKTWGTLSNQTPDGLRDILNKYGDKYRIIDPTTWPDQAALANDGKWNELITLQKNLDTGRADTATGLTDSKVEKIMIKLGILKRWNENDLKAIEGIGPKIEGLLHNAGIKTWRALSDTPVSTIQAVLDKAGSRYSLADPGTWPQQAGLAADGKWDELEELQDRLQGGK